MYDSSQTWAAVLKALRENNENVLLGICADLKDIEFSRDFITITVPDMTRYQMLCKYRTTLDKYAGAADTIQIQMNESKKESKDIVEKLQELFGEKIKIE